MRSRFQHEQRARVNRRTGDEPLSPAEARAIEDVAVLIERVQLLQDRGIVDGPTMTRALADVQSAAAAASQMIEGRR